MATELKQGDPCPACGGELEPWRSLTLEEYQQIYDRDNPRPLPLATDSAHPNVVREHGQLFVCRRCEYHTRFKTDGGAPGGQSKAA